LVVDLDPGEQWPTDEAKALDLASAPMAITPRGGRHFYFRQPHQAKLGNSVGKLASNVDTRGNGGYVLSPPSVVDGKAYRWVNELDIGPADLPLTPAWLLDALDGQQKARADKPTSSAKFKAGQRNDSLFRLACMMRRVMSEAEILAALERANADRCDPPLSADEVKAIAHSASRYDLDQQATATVEGQAKEDSAGPRIINLEGVTPLALDWLWRPRFALGTLSIIAGVPGQGKSLLSMYLTACVTTGRPWTDRPDEQNQIGSVVLLSAEDDLARTIVPRLDAAGANRRLVSALEAIVYGDSKERGVNLEKDLPHLEAAIAACQDCRLVIVDPLSAYLGKIDSHRDAEVRGLLAPLATIAAKTQTAVVGVMHLNKTQGGTAISRISGSMGFIAAARAAWLVAADKENLDRRLLLPIKNNVAPDVGGLAFRIIGKQVGDQDVGAIEWENVKVTMTADEALSEDKPRGRTAVDDCMEWLCQLLAQGPVPAAEGMEAAEVSDFTESTLRRAKRKLGVVSSKEGYQDGTRWVWSLPMPTVNGEGAHEDVHGSLAT
jgi:hypothetical protein